MNKKWYTTFHCRLASNSCCLFYNASPCSRIKYLCLICYWLFNFKTSYFCTKWNVPLNIIIWFCQYLLFLLSVSLASNVCYYMYMHYYYYYCYFYYYVCFLYFCTPTTTTTTTFAETPFCSALMHVLSSRRQSLQLHVCQWQIVDK